MPNISKNREEPRDVVKSLLGQIHMAKKDLKLSEDEYRGMLAGLTGKESCADMGLAELNRVLDALRDRGWKPKVRVGKKGRSIDPSKNDPRLKKIWKLWFLLRDAGKSSGTAPALNRFIEHQTGIRKMEWLKEEADFEKVVEGLKAICKREGVK